jgi:hypothetical protein
MGEWEIEYDNEVGPGDEGFGNGGPCQTAKGRLSANQKKTPNGFRVF